MTQEVAPLPSPAIALPQQEHDGAVAWWGGTRFVCESAADGFAFCPYEFGTLEHELGCRLRKSSLCASAGRKTNE